MSYTPTHDGYVIKSILATNQFNITQVNNLKSVKCIFFVREEYKKIEDLIKAGDIEAIKTFPEDQPRTDEFLDVMIFTDQHDKKYFVTIYDNNELLQDPQVMEIYDLK